MSSQLAALRQMIENAENALHSAKRILAELDGGEGPMRAVGDRSKLMERALDLGTSQYGGEQIVEGIFDGQNMIGPNQKAYPVPANYASKSKLVTGDVLKLTITHDGKFLYKQIGPVERKYVKGFLGLDEGHYEVIADGKAYKVLLASVTYFKASVGDEITLTVPAQGEAEWATIEHVIPRIDL